MSKTNIADLIIPLGVIGAGIYFAPALKESISGIGKGVSTAVQGVGEGVGTGVSGIGSGISTGAEGLGIGINKLGTGAGTIFEATGNAGGGIIDSAGSFGSKIFDLGESILEVPDALLDRAGAGIRSFSFGSNNQPQSQIIDVSSAVSSSYGSSLGEKTLNFLGNLAKYNPITAPAVLASNAIQKLLPKASSSKSSSSSSSTTPKTFEEAVKAGAIGQNADGSYIYAKSSSNVINDLLKPKSSSSSSSKSSSSSSSSSSKNLKVDSLSGKDKGKGSYVVTKSDGSKVKRFFQ